jgi:predicted MFS family arabinose efflux permease
MLAHLRRRIRHANPQLLLFLVAVVFLGAAGGVYETTFNNFLKDTFDLAADARGQLEFPRELPGFLVAALAGALFFLPEVRMAAVAALTSVVGMVGLATLGQSWFPMVASLFLWSMGGHLMMPLNSTIGLSLAREGRHGARLGQIAGVSTASIIIGCVIVWVGTQYAHLPYQVLFWVAATFAVAAVIVFLQMRTTTGLAQRRPTFVFRRRYGLLYVLSVLFGARKQVFLTFGPWVLVKVFNEPPATFAKLWIAAALLGVLINPQLGRAVDRFGERAILMLDALLLAGVCVGYGFAETLLPRLWALRTLYVCFVMDQLLFATGMARTTYLRKIATREEDVTATLSLTVSIDHAVSMSIPTVGGMVWLRFGYPYVFLGAACVALMNLVAASRVRVPERAAAAVSSAE